MESYKEDLPQPLRILNGLQLASVVFVRDYMQLHFDDPILSVYNPPYIVKKGNRYEWETTEFCKLIRDCINVSIETARVAEEEISLKFANGIGLFISLRSEDYRGPEAAVFSTQGNPTVVF